MSAAAHALDPTLDPAIDHRIRAFLKKLNAAGGPPMEEMTPQDARAVLVNAQKSVPVNLRPADVSQRTITQDGVQVDLTIVRPAAVTATLPVFMFFHGGGWVLGDYPTHERLIRDIVAESGAVAVYVGYTPSPEAQYPTAINQAYAATKWVAMHGNEINVDGSRLAVVGNSVGGNMAAVVAHMAKDQAGPALRLQVLMWPVTDAYFETESYEQYAEGRFLTRNMMKWFWDNYTTDPNERSEIYASPLRAMTEELQGLPPALVLTAGNDVLRDEGEEYARKLDVAGVDVTAVRYEGMIHDWGLLNPISTVPAVQASLRQVAAEIKHHLR
ncbi:alpha/beta hydrolase [Lacipirellula parvula]|uniref:Acetyl esterase/lipase n=1 Tax=Lacipirellula parvula TaxID=2650471 RepID=A0A5K7X4S1_9BACT|nr:alpha/beta hydrolase [Lacipirellula parvula]BBO30767.1 acetyl esterase/lipase [Lacipirellula parvula]